VRLVTERKKPEAGLIEKPIYRPVLMPPSATSGQPEPRKEFEAAVLVIPTLVRAAAVVLAAVLEAAMLVVVAASVPLKE
jgi:hypothetical protein